MDTGHEILCHNLKNKCTHNCYDYNSEIVISMTIVIDDFLYYSYGLGKVG